MNSNYIQDSFLHTSNYFSFLKKKNDILMAIMTNPENVFHFLGQGLLAYLGYTGMCHWTGWTGYGFLASLSLAGYTI